MGKLHELLAVEKTKVNAANKMLTDTAHKFNKPDNYFSGHVKQLKMIEDSEQNRTIEAAAYDNRQLPTTVEETLDYALDYWAAAEDIIYQKNLTNQRAVADIVLNGEILVANVPVDELLGLESRLDVLRRLFDGMPTLNAGVRWRRGDADTGRAGSWIAERPEVTTKTERSTVPVVLYEATDKHPAQVKEVSTDKTVGSYSLEKISGAATSQQKADAIRMIDELIAAVKQARMRANSVDVSTDQIGKTLVDVIMSAFA